MKPESGPKMFTVPFDGVPITLSVASGQLLTYWVAEGNILTLHLRNGCRIALGPFASPEAAEAANQLLHNASIRAEDARPTPTTKKAYLKAMRQNPWHFPFVGSEMGPPPADWIQDAWDLREVQHSIVDGGLRRDYRKGLGLSCSPERLALLSASLRTDQVVRLYCEIRDAQPEREMEFRDDFLRGFAAHAHALPPAGEGSWESGRIAWNPFKDENEIPF